MIVGFFQLVLSTLVPVALAVTAPDLDHVSVQALQNDAVVSDMTIDGQTIINQTEYTGLESFSQPDATTIQFQGDSLPPDATVTIAIPGSHSSQTTLVSADGTWAVEMPTTILPAGVHTAYMTTSDDTTVSVSMAVAQFTVHKTATLTRSTWVFLFSTFIAIVSLLLAITVQLRYNSAHYSVV